MIFRDVPELFKISKIIKFDLPRCIEIPKNDFPKCIKIPRSIYNYPKSHKITRQISKMCQRYFRFVRICRDCKIIRKYSGSHRFMEIPRCWFPVSLFSDPSLKPIVLTPSKFDYIFFEPLFPNIPTLAVRSFRHLPFP